MALEYFYIKDNAKTEPLIFTDFKPAPAIELIFTPDLSVLEIGNTFPMHLYARDANGLRSLDIGHTIAAVDLPPIARAGVDREVVQGAVVTLNGPRSWNPNGNPLSYAWSVAAANPVVGSSCRIRPLQARVLRRWPWGSTSSSWW